MKLSNKALEKELSLEKEIVCDVNPSQILKEMEILFREELDLSHRSKHIAYMLQEISWSVDRYLKCPKNTYSKYHEYGGIQGDLDWIHSNFPGELAIGDKIAIYKMCKFLNSYKLAVSWDWLKACLLNR